jgi:integrase/recombinase XerD
MLLTSLILDHLAFLAATGYSSGTIAIRRLHLVRFAEWHSLGSLVAITPALLREYQLVLAGRRDRRGRLLGLASHAQALTALRLLFRWAIRTGAMVENPALDLSSPRLPRQLPQAVLSGLEAERVLRQPDVTTPLGVRDRAILEVLYSAALRRMELINLDVRDVDFGRQVILVRQGKGKRDRTVPIGARALMWVERYLREVRGTPRSSERDPLFLSSWGNPKSRTRLTEGLRRYIVAAGVKKPGSCHIWRHTAATLMHDAGADVRDLQEFLGHAQLSTTEIYTRVSLRRLRKVHARTHPTGNRREARRKRREG